MSVPKAVNTVTGNGEILQHACAKRRKSCSLCVCVCVDDYHHSVLGLVKHASRGKAITRISQTSGKRTASTNVCQINWSWEQYDKYSLGSLYNARLYLCICQIHQQWGRGL